MSKTASIEELAACLLQVVARAAVTQDYVRDVVGTSSRHLRAFNLCDGSLKQTDIAKKLGIDSGNFSRTVARWVESGIVFRLGDGKDARLMHIYPIGSVKRGATKKK